MVRLQTVVRCECWVQGIDYKRHCLHFSGLSDLGLRSCVARLSAPDSETWQEVELYLVPGSELKAQYAFADLWEAQHGKN